MQAHDAQLDLENKAGPWWHTNNGTENNSAWSLKTNCGSHVYRGPQDSDGFQPDTR